MTSDITEMLQIAIIGIGAMGCLFAAHLTQLTSVSMLGHWPRQLSALQRTLTLETADRSRRQVKVSATSNPQKFAASDIALVLVKSYQTKQAAKDVSRLLKQDGLALTLQNGIGNDAQLAAVIGSERVVTGTTTEGATLVGPGMVRHAGRGLTILPQSAGERTPILQQFVVLLQQAGFSVSTTADVRSEIWKKLAVNTAINPVTALVEAPNGVLLHGTAASRIARQTARETALVARALGYDVEPDAVTEQAMKVARLTSQNLSSMLQDVKRQRPVEIEAITGAVIRAGRKARVPTPHNEALYALLTRKLQGDDWLSGIAKLPLEMQPLFRRLHQEGRDAGI